MATEAEAQVQLQDFQNIFSLEGKVAVVTGGSRGLGLHAASGLLQAGASKVYISSRKASACEEAVAALNALPNKRPGAQAIAVPADGSKMAELDRLVAEVSKTTDHVDILFANAGATWGAPYDEYPENAFNSPPSSRRELPLKTPHESSSPPPLQVLASAPSVLTELMPTPLPKPQPSVWRKLSLLNWVRDIF
uniref:Rhamnolipids biosynthesis 3-oxoacyl-[acyl-carrier-protein] reductase n=1 Tax=Talaromyces marneffei PM1 TaxID=1077442 RepID=A0A093VRR9_TALMA